ncbi:MAG: phosphatidylserine decarboxylase [Peptococcaceae bacterium BRH_c4b]|nr:MAG: phosphatidylserine decarboxylase [Peptococcaceae bacterium BRH_c4b]
MNREIYPVARAGLPYLIFLGVLTALLYQFNKPASFVPGSLFLFTAYFFRNPRRRVPRGEGLVISPADGVVMAVERTEEENFMGGNCTRVSIFLSILNVHINRAPVSGKVNYIHYRPGKFLPAFKSHASEINEKNFIGIESDKFKLMVTQVTGFIARRIVCYIKTGDYLDQGQRFGLIKFGSCTELYLPPEINVEVEPGDKVKGGETIIGRLHH